MRNLKELVSKAEGTHGSAKDMQKKKKMNESEVGALSFNVRISLTNHQLSRSN